MLIYSKKIYSPVFAKEEHRKYLKLLMSACLILDIAADLDSLRVDAREKLETFIEAELEVVLPEVLPKSLIDL